LSYSDSYFTARESWRDWRREARELLRWARIARGARVLEIGCGGGGLLRRAAARGADVVGVDVQQDALELARAQLQANKVAGTGNHENALHLSPRLLVSLSQIGKDNRLPFRATAFDAILAQHVIEHLPDVDAALREWWRVLNPGGRLAIATPNARYPDPAHFADADHARVFSPDELCEIVTRAGFVIEECFTMFPYLGRARLLRAFGVLAYRAFCRVPYFAARGRTIVVGAQRKI